MNEPSGRTTVILPPDCDCKLLCKKPEHQTVNLTDIFVNTVSNLPYTKGGELVTDLVGGWI